MKTLNAYMAMFYRMEIVEDKNDSGFVVSYPDLPGCITCGETIETAVANALDAKRAWIVVALENEVTIYEPDNLEDKREGISMNQHCVMRSGLSFAVEVPQYKAEVIEAMEEAKRISKDPNVKGYTDLKEMLEDLNA